jgi:hypothetical protein
MSRTIFRITRRNMKSKHKEFLLSEVYEFNGEALSRNSIELLQKLFKKKFGASISSLVVHRLLVGHQKNGNEGTHKPKCKKRSFRSTSRVLFR